MRNRQKICKNGSNGYYNGHEIYQDEVGCKESDGASPPSKKITKLDIWPNTYNGGPNWLNCPLLPP